MKYIYFLDVNSRVNTIQKRKFLKVLFTCSVVVSQGWTVVKGGSAATVSRQFSFKKELYPIITRPLIKVSSHQQRFGSRIHFKAVPDPDPCPHWALVESGSRRLKKNKKNSLQKIHESLANFMTNVDKIENDFSFCNN